ncbi:hypothetical protein NPIL_188711 [Nephila pilipes]|uniref:Uncharacterized protein n=1 Tax=Nephila pilipes TaxID=299642 RepID=A0A8X6U4R0_NEPPI|nr:hypothetical protein NPIL_188711 [Nephila pilipes]
MDLILLCLIFISPSESKYPNESASNIFIHELTNFTRHNDTYDFDAMRRLTTSTETRGNGTSVVSNFTLISRNNHTDNRTPDKISKRFIENATAIHLETTSMTNTSNATDLGRVERAADVLSGGVIFDSNSFFMNRLLFDESFPEYPIHKKIKRFDNASSAAYEPGRNLRKRFTFFRRLVFI